MRGRPQADDVRLNRYRSVVAVFGNVMQGNTNGHGERSVEMKGMPRVCSVARLGAGVNKNCRLLRSADRVKVDRT